MCCCVFLFVPLTLAFIHLLIYIFVCFKIRPHVGFARKVLLNDPCHKEVCTDEGVRNVFMTLCAKPVISLSGWFSFLFLVLFFYDHLIWFFITVKLLTYCPVL